MVALMFATATGMANDEKLSVGSNVDGKSFVYELDASSGETTIKLRENAKLVFRTVDRMVYLNLLNLSKKEVKIKIYDSSDRLVFSEKHENKMIIEKALNFKKAFKDRYTVVVKDSENTYYESIVVR